MPFVFLWTNLPAARLGNECRRALMALLADSMGKNVESTALVVQAGDGCCQIGSDPSVPALIMHVNFWEMISV